MKCAYTTISATMVMLTMLRTRTTAITAFCSLLSTWAVRTNSAALPKKVVVPVAVTSPIPSPRRTMAPA